MWQTIGHQTIGIVIPSHWQCFRPHSLVWQLAAARCWYSVAARDSHDGVLMQHTLCHQGTALVLMMYIAVHDVAAVAAAEQQSNRDASIH